MSGPYYRWHIGDTRAVLATMEPQSVQCVVTSPPYLAKRAYLPADHPDKPLEIGQEATPADFLAAQLEVMDLLWDVLADDGVAFVNLGDTASGPGGAGGDYNEGGNRAKQEKYKARWKGKDWPRRKSVCWIPELFGASIGYGRNLLTGESCRQWVTRPSITWCKPNVTPGEITDKFREATELVVFATKSERYWFDVDPLRKPPKNGDPSGSRPDRVANEKGVPPLTWQVISPSSYDGAHFATMPILLASMLVTCGCPPDGTVLDPFAGSGTTLEAALGLGRSAVGIDLDERNVALAQDRLGMFEMEVVDHLNAEGVA